MKKMMVVQRKIFTKQVKTALCVLVILFAIMPLYAGGKAESGAERNTAARQGQAKYIFLFIGDGTSITQRTAAELYLANRKNPQDLQTYMDRTTGKFPSGNGVTDFTPAIERMLMSTFPGQGFSSTYSSNSLITDSSSSATAIATGHKTRDGVVGMDPTGTMPYTSMAKLAKAKGMKVGIVTSVSLDHATPASFYASTPSRNNYYDIASQIPGTNFDYFAGGGFLARTTPQNQTQDIGELLQAEGYQMYNTRADFDRLKNGDARVIVSNVRVDAQQAMPYVINMDDDDITLSEFVAKGIEVLTNSEGFFMMVESGKVDWSCHANDALTSILDVISLDEAVKVAYEFYLKHPEETLIVVTGDHETGGMTLGFAGTHYDTFLSRLTNQKISYDAFDTVLYEFFAQNPNARFEDTLPFLDQYFGLRYYTKAQLEDLDTRAKAGDAQALAQLGMALQDYELEDLRKAFAAQPKEPDSQKRTGIMRANMQDPRYDISYGSYSPLTVAITHTLNHKAGVSWTSFSHTGLPTPVSAIGAGQELFNGYYDNTDIFKKIVQAGKLQ
jgi:alkaline phosphatase